MKVKELKKFLKKLPDDMKIMMASDSEGNNYNTLQVAQVSFYDDETGDFHSDLEVGCKEVVLLWP